MLERQIRGRIAVVANGLHGQGSHKRSVCSQTPVLRSPRCLQRRVHRADRLEGHAGTPSTPRFQFEVLETSQTASLLDEQLPPCVRLLAQIWFPNLALGSFALCVNPQATRWTRSSAGIAASS